MPAVLHGNRAYCYAELAVSSLSLAETIAMLHNIFFFITPFRSTMHSKTLQFIYVTSLFRLDTFV